MRRERKQITIRPQQQLSWLLPAALLLAGVAAAGNVYGRGVWLFAAGFAAMVVSLACDSLAFDGQILKRCGPGARLCSLLLGQKRELALEEIETISSYVVGAKRRGGEPVYRTVISGGGLRWVISSRRPSYRSFIKSLCCAVSPNKLDPRSSELFEHYQQRAPLKVWTLATHSPALMTPPRLWRKLANHLALDGQFAAASRYFRLAYRQDPHNAHLLYEMGRCLRLQATLEKQLAAGRREKAESWEQDRGPIANYLRRAEACLRLAGRLGREDAALLERIGETFFETHHHRLALRYFERALALGASRVRANLGLAEVALGGGKVARVIYFYRAAARAAEDEGERSLGRLAERKADYYERLRGDEGFLNSELGRLSLLDHLKWARRGAMFAFFTAWLVHLTCHQFAPSVQALSREISATSAIIWVSTIMASYFFSQRRN